MKVAVLGSGAGALAVAADMSRHGRRTVMASLDGTPADLEPVAATGEVAVSEQGHQTATHPVTVAAGIAEALDGAELAAVVAPCDAHPRWVQAIAPHTNPDQTLLFMGDGSGAITARRSIEPPTIIAEANTLPHSARPAGPGAVRISRKRGGVLIAALPPTPPDRARVMELVGDVWPHIDATDTVWTTVLTSYGAIRSAATDVIDAADTELLALRQAFFSRESRGYPDFMAAEGPAPANAPDTAPANTSDPANASAPDSTPPSPGHTTPGHTTEDGPGALVLASSLGRAAGVPTPVIDGLVAEASAGLGRDLRSGAPTLATLGLGGLDVTGLIGFARSGLFP